MVAQPVPFLQPGRELLLQGGLGRRTLGFGRGRCQEEQGCEAEPGPLPKLGAPSRTSPGIAGQGQDTVPLGFHGVPTFSTPPSTLHPDAAQNAALKPLQALPPRCVAVPLSLPCIPPSCPEHLLCPPAPPTAEHTTGPAAAPCRDPSPVPLPIHVQPPCTQSASRQLTSVAQWVLLLENRSLFCSANLQDPDLRTQDLAGGHKGLGGARGHIKAKPRAVWTAGRCTNYSLPAHVEELGLPNLPPGLKSPRHQPLDTLQLPSWQGLAIPTWPEGSQLLGGPPPSPLAHQLA